MKYHLPSIPPETENFKTGLLVLQSIYNITEHQMGHKTVQFEEVTSIQKKMRNEQNPTQVTYSLPLIPPKTKNYKTGLFVLQSIYNICVHGLERKTIHFVGLPSKQKKLKNSPNPTQVKYHLTSIPPETENFKTGLFVLQSIYNVCVHGLERKTIHFVELPPKQKKLKK